MNYKTNDYASIAHDFRDSQTENRVFTDIPNSYWSPNADGYSNIQHYNNIENLRKEIELERMSYYELVTGQKVQAKTALLYSAVFEVAEDTEASDIYESIGKALEDDLDTKIYGIAIHKDEGVLIDKESGRALTSGVDFAWDEKQGRFWLLSYNNSTAEFERLRPLSETELKENYEIKRNCHAHLLFCGLRSDGTSIKSELNSDKKIKKLESLGITPSTAKKAFNKANYFGEKSQWATKYHELYNNTFKHKQPIKNTMLQKGQEGEIVRLFKALVAKNKQGSKNETQTKQIENILKDEYKGLKRINGYKYFMAYLNQLAYTDEPLTQKQYKAFLTMLKQCNGDALIQSIVAMDSKQETKELQEKFLSQKELEKQLKEIKKAEAGKGWTAEFFGKIGSLIGSQYTQKELDEQIAKIKAEFSLKIAQKDNKIAELEEQNKILKAENSEMKACLSDICESLDLEKPRIMDFCKPNFLKSLAGKIKNRIKALLSLNRSEVAQISTNSILDDKLYPKEVN